MQPNRKIIYLWGTFLVLGIILMILQLYHVSLQLKDRESLKNIQVI